MPRKFEDLLQLGPREVIPGNLPGQLPGNVPREVTVAIPDDEETKLSEWRSNLRKKRKKIEPGSMWSEWRGWRKNLEREVKGPIAANQQRGIIYLLAGISHNFITTTLKH